MPAHDSSIVPAPVAWDRNDRTPLRTRRHLLSVLVRSVAPAELKTFQGDGRAISTLPNGSSLAISADETALGIEVTLGGVDHKGREFYLPRLLSPSAHRIFGIIDVIAGRTDDDVEIFGDADAFIFYQPPTPRARTKSRGFSLLEVMIALAVSSIMIGVAAPYVKDMIVTAGQAKVAMNFDRYHDGAVMHIGGDAARISRGEAPQIVPTQDYWLDFMASMGGSNPKGDAGWGPVSDTDGTIGVDVVDCPNLVNIQCLQLEQPFYGAIGGQVKYLSL